MQARSHRFRLKPPTHKPAPTSYLLLKQARQASVRQSLLFADRHGTERVIPLNRRYAPRRLSAEAPIAPNRFCRDIPKAVLNFRR